MKIGMTLCGIGGLIVGLNSSSPWAIFGLGMAMLGSALTHMLQ